MQEEPSSLQEPAYIIQIQVHDSADANLPMTISGVNIIACANMSCILYACCVILKDLPSLKIVSGMSVHSATGCDLCPEGLTCYEVIVGRLQLRHTFTMCKKLQNELLIGLDMQLLHCLGYDWTNDGWMFLHWGMDILINSIDAVTNITNLKTISSV